MPDRFNWAATRPGTTWSWGYKQKNFWVMETQPAFVNWRRSIR